MATKIIKFNNGTDTYAPVTLASAVQYSYDGGVMSVQDAIGTIASTVVSSNHSISDEITEHKSSKDYLAYNSTNGFVLSGEHGAGNVKMVPGTGVSFSYTTGGSLTISASNSHASGSDNQHLSASNVTTNKIDVSLNGSGGKVTFEGHKPNAATTTYAYVGLSYTASGSVLIKVSYTDTNTDTKQTIATNNSNKYWITGVTNKTGDQTGAVDGTAYFQAGTLYETTVAATNMYKGGKSVATEEYVNNKLTGLIDFKGNWPSTAPSSIEQYDAWRIQTASDNWNSTGHKVEVGDIVLALEANPGTTGTKWTVIQNNIDVSGLVKSISGSGDDEVSLTPTTPTGPDANGNVALTVSHASHNVGNISASDKNVTGTSGQQKVITGITVNSFGHVTGYTAANIYSTDTKSDISGEYRAAAKSAYIKLANNTGEVGFYDNGGKTTAGSHIAYIQFTYTSTSTDKKGIGLKVSYTDTNTAVAKIGSKSTNDVPLYVGPNATNSGAGTGGNTMTFVQSTNITLTPDTTNNKLTIAHATPSGAAAKTSALYKIATDSQGHVTSATPVTITKNLKYDLYPSDVDFTLPIGTAESTGNTIVTNIS